MMSMSSTGWALVGLAASLAICAPAAALVALRRHKENQWRLDSNSGQPLLQLHSSHRIDITGDNHPHRRGRARIDLIPHGYLIGGQMIVRRHREHGQLRSCRPR
jgi:hypothetical protein